MISGKGDRCCGCGACFCICPRNAIKMQANEKGFYEPDVDLNLCINCGLCNKVCPLVQKQINKENINNYYAAQRKDKELLKKSQSGGAFSVFAESVLEENGIVYGVATVNRVVKYVRVDSINDLSQLRGSKYVQASTEDIFKHVREDLAKQNYVLFSGTPCIVHALFLFLKASKVSLGKLITVDLICHGVPSPKMYSDFLDFFDDMLQTKITDINFRDKSFGWESHVVTLSNKKIKYADHNYPIIYYSHLPLRDCCYVCHYANLKRVSDISVGDCWGIDKITDKFQDTGCSLIIINSEKGKKLFSETSNELNYIPINIENVLQPNLQKPSNKPEQVDIFWSDYNKYGFEYAATRYCDFRSYYGNLLFFKEPIYKKVLLKIKKKLWSDYYGK